MYADEGNFGGHQKAAIEPMDCMENGCEESHHQVVYNCRNSQQATVFAWCALMSMLASLALATGGVKKLVCFLTAFVFLFESGGVHDRNTTQFANDIKSNTGVNILFLSPQ